MRKWFVVPILAALALPLAAVADDAASVKKQIEANFAKTMAAFKKHDIKGVMANTADDFEGVGETGQKIDRKAMQAQMQGYMDTTKKVNSSKYTVSDMKVAGNKATGKTTFLLDAVVTDAQGTMGPKGKTHHLQVEEHTTVTWTKAGKTWMTSKEAPAGMPKMIVDGKAFNPMAPPQTPKKK